MSRASQVQDQFVKKLPRCYQFERNHYLRCCMRPIDYVVPACWEIPRRSSPETKARSIWHRLAGVCRERGVDAIRYIRWSLSFEQLLMQPPPEPNQLLQLSRMNAFDRTRANRERSMEVLFVIYTRSAKANYAYLKDAQTSAAEAWAQVLCSRASEYSGLFRHVKALAIGGKKLTKIAKLFEQEALLNYHFDPDICDRVYGRLIPPGFRARAEEFYNLVLSRSPDAGGEP